MNIYHLVSKIFNISSFIVLVFVRFVLFFFGVKSILYIFALGNKVLPLYIQIE